MIGVLIANVYHIFQSVRKKSDLHNAKIWRIKLMVDKKHINNIFSILTGFLKQIEDLDNVGGKTVDVELFLRTISIIAFFSKFTRM